MLSSVQKTYLEIVPDQMSRITDFDSPYLSCIDREEWIQGEHFRNVIKVKLNI